MNQQLPLYSVLFLKIVPLQLFANKSALFAAVSLIHSHIFSTLYKNHTLVCFKTKLKTNLNKTLSCSTTQPSLQMAAKCLHVAVTVCRSSSPFKIKIIGHESQSVNANQFVVLVLKKRQPKKKKIGCTLTDSVDVKAQKWKAEQVGSWSGSSWWHGDRRGERMTKWQKEALSCSEQGFTELKTNGRGEGTERSSGRDQ